MIKLIVNGTQLDLDEETRIQITKLRNDIGDMQSKSSYTNSISVPHTPTNDLALQFSADLNSTSRIPYSKLSCTLIVDSLEIFADGSCYIDGSEPKYQIMLLGDMKSFNKLIETKTLNDLDLDDLNHAWNYTNAITLAGDVQYLYTETNSSPAGAVSVHKTANSVYIANQHPSVKVMRLMEQICTDAGYTMNAGDLATNKIGEAFLFCPDTTRDDPTFIAGVWGADFDKAYGKSSPMVGRGASIPIYSSYTQSNIIYENQGGMVSQTGAFAKYTVKFQGSYKIEMLGTILNPNLFTVKVYVMVEGFGKYLLETASTATIDINGSQVLSLARGNKISIHIEQYGTNGVTYPNSQITLKSGFHFGVSQNAPFTFQYGDTFFVNSALPKMKQLDFFKGICQIGFLVPDIDNVNKTVTFKQIESVVLNKNNPQDWSNYLVSKKSQKFKFGEWAQINNLTYDSDKETETFYGNGTVVLNNDLLPDKKEMAKVPFSASLEVERMINDLPFAYIPIYQNRIWKGGMKPRLLVPEPITETVSLINYGGTVLATTTTAKAGVFDLVDNSIAFNKQIHNYFQGYQSILDRMKSIEVELILPVLEFHTFDQFRPVYLKQYGAFFYCNKINGWEDGAICTAELIKI